MRDARVRVPVKGRGRSGWRVAFDEEYLKPGNAGAIRTAEHFRECVDRVPTKRVKLVEWVIF
jgi:hypothetical protein